MTSFLLRIFEYTLKWCTYSADVADMQSHVCRVHEYLAITCHLHFWQNDKDLLCAPEVTQGWNGYQNKSARMLILEKKIFLPLLTALPEAVTSNSLVGTCQEN